MLLRSPPSSLQWTDAPHPREGQESHLNSLLSWATLAPEWLLRQAPTFGVLRNRSLNPAVTITQHQPHTTPPPRGKKSRQGLIAYLVQTVKKNNSQGQPGDGNYFPLERWNRGVAPALDSLAAGDCRQISPSYQSVPPHLWL